MSTALAGKHIAFLFTDGVEQAELTEPLKAVREAGATAHLISLKTGGVQMVQHDEKGDVIEAEEAIADADADGYDALVLPGGGANPDRLRTESDCVRFVQEFFSHGKPVGAICHGPWLLSEADVLRGRTVTSWPSLRTDLTNAGATWVDEEVHVDNGLVTSRKPDDLPEFCAKVVEEFAEGRHTRQAEQQVESAIQ